MQQVTKWLTTGNQLQSRRTPDALLQAVATFDNAIALLERLDPEIAEYCDVLAGAHSNRGIALFTLGTRESLRQAVAAYDQAINLRKKLDLNVAEYRDALAITHNNRGNALSVLGTPESLRLAVTTYKQAIDLLEKLDLGVAKYRSNLAMAHRNRGIALFTLGTPESLRKAVAAYDQAIALNEKLDLDVAKYRSTLAQAHSYRGNALSTLGTPESLRQAVAAYEQAIDLGMKLDLNVAEYRHELAMSYTNRGLLLSDLGTLESLEQAIVDYGLSIFLSKELDLNVAAYRNELAKAHMSCGITQSAFGTSESLRQAVASIETAIALNDELPATWLDATEIALMARTGAAFCLLQSDDPADLDSAADLAKEACARAAASEAYADRRWRSNREYAFALALQAYLVTTPGFIPEFVLEHLDPAQPGAAPDSRPMLDSARSFLYQLLAHPDITHHPTWTTDAHRALLVVAKAEALYFSATLDSAQRRAERLLQDGQRDAALAQLTDYTERHADDPDGLAALATFCQRLGNQGTALDHIAAAFALVLDYAMPLDEVAAREKLSRLLKLGVTCHLGAPGLDGAGARERMLERCDAALAWLQRISEALGARLGDEEFACFDAARSVVQSERRQWLDARDREHEQELLNQIDQRIGSVIDILKETLAAFIPRAWRQVVGELLDSLHAVLREAAAGGSNPEAPAPDQEMLIRAMGFRLRSALENLGDAELAEARSALNDELGPLWGTLAETEQSLLATGLRLMTQSGCEAFAALSFAQVVEQELRQRLYLPLRKYLVEQGQRVDGAPNSEPDRAIAEFVSGQRSHVTMAPLLVGYFRAVAGGSTPASQWLRQVMDSWPAAHLILAASDDARRHREAELRFLLDRRNACAHANDPITGEQLRRLRHAVVGDAEHGFLRYFVGEQWGAVA